MELLPHTLSLLSPFPPGHDAESALHGDARGKHDMATMDAELSRGDSAAPTAESPAQPQQQQQAQQSSSGAAVPLTAAQQQQQGMSFRRLAALIRIASPRKA